LLFRTNAQYWVDRASCVVGSQSNGSPSPLPLSPKGGEGHKGAVPAPVAEPATGPVQGIVVATAVPRPAAPAEPPEGEQFQELTHWLEMGLTRLEIEAIKARGVSQLLFQLYKTLEAACPPDLTDVAYRTQAVWGRVLGDVAEASAAILLNTLEPYQREIEHHFALERQSRFRGPMAYYLQF